MTSFYMFLTLLSVSLCTVPGSVAQGSEEDNGGSMELVSSIHQPQIESKPQKVDNPSESQSSPPNLGGAHLWQSPFDSHITGDPQEMRYGWTYQVNNDPSVAATYNGVPNEHFHKKLDADMNTFSPSYRGWDQNLAALNEVVPNMNTKTVSADSVHEKASTDVTPAKDTQAIKTENVHKSEIAQTTEEKNDPKTTVYKEQSKATSSETQAKQDQSLTVKLPLKEMSPIVNLEKSYEAPIFDMSSFARANAYTTCGGSFSPRQIPEQQSQQRYEQNFYLIPRQQMPMFEQQQNVPGQPIMIQPGQMLHFDQRQQMPAADQQTPASDQTLIPRQQPGLVPDQQMVSPDYQMSHEMQAASNRQMPMRSEGQQQQSQTFTHQLPRQQQPMLIPNQQQQMPMQAAFIPNFDQRQILPQQSIVPNQQQQIPMSAPPTQTLDQRQTLPQQLPISNQQQQAPMQAPPMASLEQRQTLPQQLPISNQQQQMPAQVPPMPTLDQRQSFPQQSMLAPSQPMPGHGIRQMQPMLVPTQQQTAWNPEWNQQPTFQQQQMWTNPNMFEQRTAVTEEHMLNPNVKPTQEAPASSQPDSQPSSNILPPPEQPAPRPDIFKDQMRQQQMQNFERQMPSQMVIQSDGQMGQKDATSDSSKPTVSTLDQGKLDEMRAIMDEMPQARTFKKLKGGLAHTVFVVPGVYGGYAGGYASPTYVSPAYAAPVYGSHGHSSHSYGLHLHHGYSPYVSQQNPTSNDDSALKQNPQGTNLQPMAGPPPEKEITFSTQTRTIKTLEAPLPVTEEDTMVAAASEDDPTTAEDFPNARGCTCRRATNDNDDDYDGDNDQHVAAVPIQIHPDGSHRISSDVVGSTVWTPGMVKPYAGLWDPKGFLGRFLKPSEPLIYQPPTVGVAYVPVQKVGSEKSANNNPTHPSSWAASIRQSQEHLVGSPRAPPRASRTRSSTRNCNRRQAPPTRRPSLLGSVIKPASALVETTKKTPESSTDTEPTPSASSLETVGQPQQPESSSVIEGCVRQCLNN